LVQNFAIFHSNPDPCVKGAEVFDEHAFPGHELWHRTGAIRRLADIHLPARAWSALGKFSARGGIFD